MQKEHSSTNTHGATALLQGDTLAGARGRRSCALAIGFYDRLKFVGQSKAKMAHTCMLLMHQMQKQLDITSIIRQKALPGCLVLLHAGSQHQRYRMAWCDE